METPIRATGRELLSNDRVNQTDLCLATGLPPWKISRLFKRLELLGFIKAEEEPRFTRGRPRKLCKLTPSGIEYFTGLLRERTMRTVPRALPLPWSAQRRAGEGDGS